MPFSTWMTVTKRALRKKAALWLVIMGIAAAFAATPAAALQQCPTDSQIRQQIIQASIADYQSTTGGAVRVSVQRGAQWVDVWRA
jgi:hypothetical protein